MLQHVHKNMPYRFHRSWYLVKLLLRCACSWTGLRVLFYGDSLTAGAPSMCSYAEEFCKCLTAAGCYIEGTVCGLCAASAYEMLEIAQEPFVLDSLQSRWGSGIAYLASQADLVVIMAGTNDLAFADGKHIFKSLHGLHMACHRLGVATVALGIPDSGGRSIKRLVERQIPAQRREANSLLASWAKGTNTVEGTPIKGTNLLTPEVFVNSVALMPFGPQSRNAGYWETDGVHFTAAGAKVLGYRLAEVLRPLILRQGESCLTPWQPISACHFCHTDAEFCGRILNHPWIILNPWEVPSWLHGCKDQWTCSCWRDPFAQCFLGSIRFGGLLTSEINEESMHMDAHGTSRIGIAMLFTSAGWGATQCTASA